MALGSLRREPSLRSPPGTRHHTAARVAQYELAALEPALRSGRDDETELP
jgi:hypothetical protein